MKIAIISDIHGNLEALKATLKDIEERKVDKIICLGDIIAKGVHPKECLSLIRTNCEIVLLGNCDVHFSTEHKNIDEIANYMLSEIYFPYVIFLEGSNFITETIEINRPDGRKVKLEYKSGSLNRLDRLTAANYGMPFNKNLCENKFVPIDDRLIMLQAASMYTTGNGEVWQAGDMLNIMIDISETSIRCLARDIFKQLAGKNDVEDEKE